MFLNVICKENLVLRAKFVVVTIRGTEHSDISNHQLNEFKLLYSEWKIDYNLNFLIYISKEIN